ncbi:hypothetical protein [Novosphingobium lentum]|uniref:hypothetical protein n=1 Tax=Novosphingobium lentum TaxID=145287 RepID=UPI000837506F|nr:hypothetical protein [Novosphingobium lentum]
MTPTKSMFLLLSMLVAAPLALAGCSEKTQQAADQTIKSAQDDVATGASSAVDVGARKVSAAVDDVATDAGKAVGEGAHKVGNVLGDAATGAANAVGKAADNVHESVAEHRARATATPPAH